MPPIDRFGYSAAMLNQKISCTSTGVPRKKVMYTPAVAAIGLMREDLMIARTSPSSVPRTMLTTVNTIVRTRPRRIDSLVKYLATTSHWKWGLVETEAKMPSASKDAHRPGGVLERSSPPEPRFEGRVQHVHRRACFRG